MNQRLKNVIAGIAVFLGFISFIAFVFHKNWPRIADAELLRSECRALFLSKNGLAREIPKKDWPDSIRTLDPRGVFIDDGFVEVLVSSGGIGPSRGFYILTSSKPLPFVIDGATIFRTEHEGVYRFDIHD
jgi:hypothetical protein